MVLSPQLHPFDMVGAAEVMAVLGFLQPAPLALRFAGLLAGGLEAIALASRVAIIGNKESLTMQTLALSGWVSHGPRSPRDHDRRGPDETEEDREQKTKEKKEQHRGRRGEI